MADSVQWLSQSDYSICISVLVESLKLDRNTENMCSISRRKHCADKKRKQFVIFDYQNVNSLCSRHHYVNSSC